MKKISFLAIIIAVVMFSCKKETIVIEKENKSYFLINNTTDVTLNWVSIYEINEGQASKIYYIDRINSFTAIDQVFEAKTDLIRIEYSKVEITYSYIQREKIKHITNFVRMLPVDKHLIVVDKSFFSNDYIKEE